jgi:hypothetical protein
MGKMLLCHSLSDTFSYELVEKGRLPRSSHSNDSGDLSWKSDTAKKPPLCGHWKWSAYGINQLLNKRSSREKTVYSSFLRIRSLLFIGQDISPFFKEKLK